MHVRQDGHPAVCREHATAPGLCTTAVVRPIQPFSGRPGRGRPGRLTGQGVAGQGVLPAGLAGQELAGQAAALGPRSA